MTNKERPDSSSKLLYCQQSYVTVIAIEPIGESGDYVVKFSPAACQMIPAEVRDNFIIGAKVRLAYFTYED